MKVAWINPKDPIESDWRDMHRCNVCNKSYPWDDEMGYYEKSIGEGYQGYEVQFIVCSQECNDKAVKEGMIENFYKNK